MNNCETENCYCRIDLCPPTFSFTNHVERSDGGRTRTVELGGARDNAGTVESGVQCEQPPPAYSTLHFPTDEGFRGIDENLDEMSRQMDEGFRRMDENLDEMSRQMDEKDNHLDK